MCGFTQRDILNIRMTMLYSWLTGGDFNIDMKSTLGIDPGINKMFLDILLCGLRKISFFFVALSIVLSFLLMQVLLWV